MQGAGGPFIAIFISETPSSSRACRAEKLISEFTYYDSRGIAVATIFSMFKTASSNRTFFQCDVEICSGPCPKPVCGGLYTGADAKGLQSLSEVGSS